VSTFRVALAQLSYPSTPDESVARAIGAIEEAARAQAQLVCFPECYVPGYRGEGHARPPPDAAWLERAWSTIASAARITVVLGTERIHQGNLLATALVIDADGRLVGFQDKVQIDPSEEGTYAHGSGRRVFRAGPLTFGIVICHEGWRYPETVRFAARQGAQVVFHPHLHGASPRAFHEPAVLCRAAENTCWFATVNYAVAGSPTTAAVARPDGTLLCQKPHGEPGLLLADLDLSAATGLLASRYRP
jgi:predicted amidohydrolase